MNRLTKLILVCTLFLLMACGSEEEPTPTPPTPTTAAAPAEQPATVAQPAAPVAIVEAIVLPTPDPAQVNGVIQMEGSTTVHQITQAVARNFTRQGYQINLQMKPVTATVAFANFCQADSNIDILNAPRQMNEQEAEACKAIEREPLEFQIAKDIAMIVVHRDNTFLSDATPEQLAHIFSNEATNWSDIDPSWPQEPIMRYIPSEAVGLFRYFVRVVMNPVYAPQGAADPNKGRDTLLAAPNLQLFDLSEDLLEAVSQDPNGIGFVSGLDYNNADIRLKLLSLNGFPPQPEYYYEGQYPLLRAMFLYTNAEVMHEKPQVAAFINFYLGEVNRETTTMGLTPLDEEVLNAGRQLWLDTMQK